MEVTRHARQVRQVVLLSYYIGTKWKYLSSVSSVSSRVTT